MEKLLEFFLKENFTSVFIDSRQVQEGGLFIPIKGEKFNGNSFIQSALKQGAKASLVSRDYYESNKSSLDGCNIYVVEDTLETLQQLARSYRKYVDPFVIGITGSNGKTTVKNMVAAILKRSHKTHETKGNYNNEIGLPITILNMSRDTRYLVLEMGMGNSVEIGFLAELSKADAGIITNIGTNHIEFYGSKENILREKMEITKYFEKDHFLVVNGDDELLGKAEEESFPLYKISLSKVDHIKEDKGFYSFCYEDMEFHLQVPGRFQVSNALLAVELCRHLPIDKVDMEEGINSYLGEAMRFVVCQHKAMTFINDSYNASYLSIKASVETLLQMPGTRKIFIVGDVLELGALAQKEHERIGRIEEIHRLDQVFTVGNYAKEISYKVRGSLHFNDISSLNNYLKVFLQEGDTVLVKASRGMQLERIINYLKENL